jgi:hypothetical protein
MTLSAGTVSLTVKGNATGFGKKLKDDISKEAKSSGLSGIGKVLGGTIAAGIGAAMVGIGAIVATGIGEAKDASAGTAQLAAGIKSTGNAANVSVKGMNDLASSIQGMSGQTDDSIVASEKLLLTFTSIKNQGPDKIFDQATLAAANMAAKMGGDAASQSILLGKALNDPVKGITALTRVGVSFTDGQKASIAAMVKTGDTVGAQKIILKELSTEFGGAAKAAGESLPGQLALGQRAFEDLSQSVVETLLPLVLPAIKFIVDALKKFAPVAVDVASKVKTFLVQAFKDAKPAIDFVWGVLKNLGSFFVTTLIPAISKFGGWVKDNSKWLGGLALVVVSMIVAFKAYNIIMGIVKIATIAWTVVQGILNGTLIANPIGLIVMAIAGLVAGIIWVATQTTFFQDVWKRAMTGITAVVNWAWKSVLKPVFDFIGTAVRVVGGAFGTVFGAIGGIIRGAFNGVVSFVKGIFNTIIGVVNGIISGINGATSMAGAIGIHIGAIPHLPKLADSGTVLPRPGGTLALIAEGGKAESVVDTGKLNNLMDSAARGGGGGSSTRNVSVTFVNPVSKDPVQSAREAGQLLIASIHV